MLETLDAWVDYLQTLHAREIDLSLERVKTVYQRLRPAGVGFKIITVAGTNGKGSTCELLSSIYHAAGYQTGKYTSPHIIKFNERFNINRSDVSNVDLLAVLQRIENVRGDVSLTFFEFGTLAAIELFCDQRVDVAIMEVGLGGRLDAVNILDCDLAVVTSISIDHVDWLGSTIEEIAGEKIAIARTERPCVIGFRDPPLTMLEYCENANIPVSRLGVDYDFSRSGSDWTWRLSDPHSELIKLPLPFAQLGIQLQNASAALTSVNLLQNSLPVPKSAMFSGVDNAHLAARRQIISREPLIIVDVAHNEASIASLVSFVKDLNYSGKAYAICGMLKDKQIKRSFSPLIGIIDEWNLVTIKTDRGADAQLIDSILYELSDNLFSFCFTDARKAYDSVWPKLKKDDVLIVFGSFFVAGDIMSALPISDV